MRKKKELWRPVECDDWIEIDSIRLNWIPFATPTPWFSKNNDFEYTRGFYWHEIHTACRRTDSTRFYLCIAPSRTFQLEGRQKKPNEYTDTSQKPSRNPSYQYHVFVSITIERHCGTSVRRKGCPGNNGRRDEDQQQPLPFHPFHDPSCNVTHTEGTEGKKIQGACVRACGILAWLLVCVGIPTNGKHCNVDLSQTESILTVLFYFCLNGLVLGLFCDGVPCHATKSCCSSSRVFCHVLFLRFVFCFVL